MGKLTTSLKSFLLRLLAETKDNKVSVILAASYIILSYSIYLYLDDDLVSKLGREENLFESVTPVFFLAAVVVYFKVFRKKKNAFFLLLSLAFFIGAGEEISWGQRLLHFAPPKAISRVNVQHELNIHNLEPFNPEEFGRILKTGWARLTDINTLYKFFWFFYGIILPIINYWVRRFQEISNKIKLPVPPLSLGIFFMFNYLTMRTLGFALQGRGPYHYLDTAGEIYECGTALIFLLIGLVFLKAIKEPSGGPAAEEAGPEGTP